MMHKLLLLCLLVLSSVVGQAKEGFHATAGSALEKHVMELAQELRCLVCQNQTIADSHADLAIDLRNQVREKLAQGMSDQQVIDFMVQRYGDFILYRPPIKSTTWLLWFGPFLLFVAGFSFFVIKLKKQVREASADELPEPDMRRAAALLASISERKETT